ncbi:MAG: hemolysin family protein [Clostridiales bacterium]|nr:hemolysin family protein [Clostridiales bacterium]
MIFIAVIFCLLFCSSFFSASETAFSGLNRVRMKNLAAEGNKRAKSALKLSENFDVLLSTILIGNNIINILMTSLATLVFTGWFGNAGVTVSTIVMTVLILIFGEVTPKSVAKERAEQFAMFCAPVLRALIGILWPVNVFFKSWNKLLTKLFHLGRYDIVTEEELITYVDEAQSGGEIEPHEGELIRSAIEFNDVDVADILTPRVDVVAVEKNESIAEIAKRFRENHYSRLPVYAEDIDHIVGVINERDFRRVQDKKLKSIRTILSPVPSFSENTKISRVLRQLQKRKTHLGIVVDEFGGTVGIVTMEDVLEELVGEIWDEHDEVPQEMIELPDGAFEVNCNCPLDKFAERFHIDEEYDVSSVGGWVMDELDKIPEVDDTFTYRDLKVTVLRVESRRASLIHVRRMEEDHAV